MSATLDSQMHIHERESTACGRYDTLRCKRRPLWDKIMALLASFRWELDTTKLGSIDENGFTYLLIS